MILSGLGKPTCAVSDGGEGVPIRTAYAPPVRPPVRPSVGYFPPGTDVPAAAVIAATAPGGLPPSRREVAKRPGPTGRRPPAVRPAARPRPPACPALRRISTETGISIKTDAFLEEISFLIEIPFDRSNEQTTMLLSGISHPALSGEPVGQP